MTKEAVEYNLSRIEVFLSYAGKLPRVGKERNEIEVLLINYSQLLDWSGAGRDQYSLLFLTKPDYDELAEHTSLFTGYKFTDDFHSENLPTGPPAFCRGYFSFQYLGFTWKIKQISYYPIIQLVNP